MVVWLLGAHLGEVLCIEEMASAVRNVAPPRGAKVIQHALWVTWQGQQCNSTWGCLTPPNFSKIKDALQLSIIKFPTTYWNCHISIYKWESPLHFYRGGPSRQDHASPRYVWCIWKDKKVSEIICVPETCDDKTTFCFPFCLPPKSSFQSAAFQYWFVWTFTTPQSKVFIIRFHRSNCHLKVCIGMPQSIFRQTYINI